MIEGTHPAFERLAREGSAPSSPELRAFLESLGVDYVDDAAGIRFATEVELLEDGNLHDYLEQGVPAPLRQHLRIEIHRSTHSTNDLAMSGLAQSEAVLCTAEMQTAGKGRRGRRWVSPFGHNIYLSYGRFVRRPLPELGGLSLLAGMQVVDVLRQLGLREVGLKWPNDVVLDGGKLAGILVELQPPQPESTGVVIGIGINLRLDDGDAALIDQPWRAVSAYRTISRNELLGRLSVRLINATERFNREGFEPFFAAWDEYNSHAGSEVVVRRGNAAFTGIDRGVDRQGNLLLQTDAGIEVHNAGEVSLRSA